MAATRRVAVVWCIVLTLVAWMVASPAAAATGSVEFSVSPDRSLSTALDGATVNGEIFVFFTPDVPVSQALFYLDDPTMAGTPIKAEARAPYDLAGTAKDGSALPFDVATLSGGSHTLTVSAPVVAGGTVRVTVTFDVGAPSPSPSPSTSPSPSVSPSASVSPSPSPTSSPPPSGVALLVSATPDRADPRPVAGSTLIGDVFVFVVSDKAVKEVRFHLDDPNFAGTPIKIEKGAPYDLAGTAADRTAKPFNVDQLTPGTHTLTTRTFLTDGSAVTTQAAFSTPMREPDPQRAPDQVHLSWTADTSTTLTVVWHTASTASPSEVQYRKMGATTWSTASGGLRPSGADGTLHEATLTGLTPDTAYEYRVPGDGGAWSEVFTTRTAPASGPADFDVIYFADTGIVGRADGLATGTQQAVDEIAALDPLLVLPGGDYAYFNTETRYADVDQAIDAWFDQIQTIVSSAPMMPVYGNHEALLRESVSDWAPRFATPNGWNGRRAYSFDVADVHFVALYAVTNTAKLESGQVTWLRNDLTAARDRGVRWIVPYFHVAPFADGYSHPSNTALRAQVGPIFEEFGVDVVLTSHDQSYERTFALTDVGASNTHTTEEIDCLNTSEGTTYLKVSPAGKMSNLNGTFSVFQTFPAPSWTAVRDDTMHHFSRLRFSAEGTLRVETVGFTGDGSSPILIDAFEYRADGGCATGRTLEVEPGAISLTADPDQPTVSATVEVTASDEASVDLNLSEGSLWLSVPPTAVTGPITVNVDVSTLGPGVHSSGVMVTSATHGVTRVPVEVTVPGTTLDRLAVSTSSARTAPVSLDGGTVSGTVYIFTDGMGDDVSLVRFYLDDPTLAGTPFRSESTAPFDFAGGSVSTARGWNTGTVAPGVHTITAVVFDSAGSHTLTATFAVA